MNDEDISSSTNREFSKQRRKRRERGNEIETKEDPLRIYSHLNGSIVVFKKDKDDLIYALAAAKIAVTD